MKRIGIWIISGLYFSIGIIIGGFSEWYFMGASVEQFNDTPMVVSGVIALVCGVIFAILVFRETWRKDKAKGES